MRFAQVPAVPPAAVPEDACVLDVREPEEWRAGHAKGAVHIPMGEIVARIHELPADQRVHVVCRVGGRSAQVTQYLIVQGLDAVNVDGGMLAWASSGCSLEADGDGPASVL